MISAVLRAHADSFLVVRAATQALRALNVNVGDEEKAGVEVEEEEEEEEEEEAEKVVE